MSMYYDKDSRGTYSIMEIDREDFQVISLALDAYKIKNVSEIGAPHMGPATHTELRERYHRAGRILDLMDSAL
jgi:hypothetical protein